MPKVEFYGELKKETDAAFLVFDGVNEIWIPKSQTEVVEKFKDGNRKFEIPEWLAKKKGII